MPQHGCCNCAMGGRSCYWWIVDGVVEAPPRTQVMLDLHERGKALAEVAEVLEQYKEENGSFVDTEFDSNYEG